jgi:PAS domain S-box-containing protein
MSTRKTILVVEDDPALLALEARSLELAGHATRSAGTAEEALRQLRGGGADLLLLDYRLPGGVDGLALYEMARAGGCDAPAILVTGFADEATVSRAMRAGVRDFVDKSPGHLDRLAQAVERVLGAAPPRPSSDPPPGPDPWTRHLAAVWEASLDAMRLTDAAGTILRVNGAYCRLVGRPREELEGRPFALGYAEAGRREALDRHGVQFASGRCESLALRLVRLWDGREVHLEFSSSFLEAPGEPRALLSIIRDASERVALEGRLRQSQKMDAVGRLAGGVAHDFNNLLTAINGYAQFLYDALADESQRAMAAEVVKAGDRAANLTRQLLALSRQQLLAPRLLDLSAVVADMARLLRRLIGEDVELAAAAAPGLWLVEADPGSIEQVILNLAVNARDAMPQGGKLTVETRNVVLDEEYARGRPDARAGPHVLLAVSDTGCGMSEEVKARAFEPFFTTKGERGTGLGLATVYGAVKQAGGHVALYSEPGRGSTFSVYLPRASGQPASGRSSLGLRLPGGSETVLLVEDDPALRALAERVLSGCGYEVLAAADGAEALEAAGRHGGAIDLLVTDVVMPRLGGGQLAQRLAASRPGMKVLYVSGYADDAVVRHGVLRQGAPFLHKPFSAAALAQKVREVLGGG